MRFPRNDSGLSYASPSGSEELIDTGRAILADREEWEGMTSGIANPAVAIGAATPADSKTRRRERHTFESLAETAAFLPEDG
jgi:hypothetical protein